jgi:hypothetical protein
MSLAGASTRTSERQTQQLVATKTSGGGQTRNRRRIGTGVQHATTSTASGHWQHASTVAIVRWGHRRRGAANGAGEGGEGGRR